MFLLRCGRTAVVVVLTVLLTSNTVTSRRNSKFARNWEMLDRLHPKTNIKRHIVERTRYVGVMCLV